MNIPKLPAETKPFLWGVAAGGAEKLAGTRAENVLVSVLTPICVAQVRTGAKAQANGAEPDRQIATACAEALTKLAP